MVLSIEGQQKRSSCSGFGRTSFSQVKNENQVIHKSASVIFELDRLTQKSISRGARVSAAHTLCLQGILLFKKLSNKQSGSVIFRPVRLIIL